MALKFNVLQQQQQQKKSQQGTASTNTKSHRSGLVKAAASGTHTQSATLMQQQQQHSTLAARRQQPGAPQQVKQPHHQQRHILPLSTNGNNNNMANLNQYPHHYNQQYFQHAHNHNHQHPIHHQARLSSLGYTTRQHLSQQRRHIRLREYKNLRQVIPSLRIQRTVSKVEVVSEAARYIDQLHKSLLERFVTEGIPDNLKGLLRTQNANHLKPHDIMELVSKLASSSLQQHQQMVQPQQQPVSHQQQQPVSQQQQQTIGGNNANSTNNRATTANNGHRLPRVPTAHQCQADQCAQMAGSVDCAHSAPLSAGQSPAVPN